MKIIITLLILLFITQGVSATSLTYISPTPADNAVVYNTGYELNVSVFGSYLMEFDYDLDGNITNYWSSNLIASYDLEPHTAIGASNEDFIDIENEEDWDNGADLYTNPMTSVSGLKIVDNSPPQNVPPYTYANHGSYYPDAGVSWAPSVNNGYAVYFDGSEDYIRINRKACEDCSELNPSSFTLEVRFKADPDKGSASMGLFGNKPYSASTQGFNMLLDSGGLNIGLIGGIGNDTANQKIFSPAQRWDDKYYTVAMTYNGGTGKTIIYVDGVETVNETILGLNYSGLNDFVIGGTSVLSVEGDIVPVYPFMGWIDQVMLYDTVLSPSEILSRVDLSMHQASDSYSYFKQNQSNAEDGVYTFSGNAEFRDLTTPTLTERSVTIGTISLRVSWGNNYTNDQTRVFTVPGGTSVLLNATVYSNPAPEQGFTYTWNTATQLTGNGTKSTTAVLNPSDKTYRVYVEATNENATVDSKRFYITTTGCTSYCSVSAYPDTSGSYTAYGDSDQDIFNDMNNTLLTTTGGTWASSLTMVAGNYYFTDAMNLGNMLKLYREGSGVATIKMSNTYDNPTVSGDYTQESYHDAVLRVQGKDVFINNFTIDGNARGLKYPLGHADRSGVYIVYAGERTTIEDMTFYDMIDDSITEIGGGNTTIRRIQCIAPGHECVFLTPWRNTTSGYIIEDIYVLNPYNSGIRMQAVKDTYVRNVTVEWQWNDSLGRCNEIYCAGNALIINGQQRPGFDWVTDNLTIEDYHVLHPPDGFTGVHMITMNQIFYDYLRDDPDTFDGYWHNRNITIRNSTFDMGGKTYGAWANFAEGSCSAGDPNNELHQSSGVFIRNSDNVTFDNVSITGTSGPGVWIHNNNDFQFGNVSRINFINSPITDNGNAYIDSQGRNYKTIPYECPGGGEPYYFPYSGMDKDFLLLGNVSLNVDGRIVEFKPEGEGQLNDDIDLTPLSGYMTLDGDDLEPYSFKINAWAPAGQEDSYSVLLSPATYYFFDRSDQIDVINSTTEWFNFTFSNFRSGLRDESVFSVIAWLESAYMFVSNDILGNNRVSFGNSNTTVYVHYSHVSGDFVENDYNVSFIQPDSTVFYNVSATDICCRESGYIPWFLPQEYGNWLLNFTSRNITSDIVTVLNSEQFNITDPSTPSGNFSVLNGWIKDYNTTEGIPFTTITLTKGYTINTYTDESGYYLIPDLYAGNYTLTASKTNYTTGSISFEIFNDSIVTKNLFLTCAAVCEVEVDDPEPTPTETYPGVTPIITPVVTPIPEPTSGDLANTFFTNTFILLMTLCYMFVATFNHRV